MTYWKGHDALRESDYRTNMMERGVDASTKTRGGRGSDRRFCAATHCTKRSWRSYPWCQKHWRRVMRGGTWERNERTGRKRNGPLNPHNTDYVAELLRKLGQPTRSIYRGKVT